MMKAADPGQPHNFRVRRWSSFQISALWRILDRSVNPVCVVIVDVVPEKPMQVHLVQHNHVIDEFALA